jgi:hypothetical protein
MKKTVKAWAVIDTSGALGRNPYIDCTADGNTYAIHFSKSGGLHNHRAFKGKRVVRCTITYSVPAKRKRV